MPSRRLFCDMVFWFSVFNHVLSSVSTAWYLNLIAKNFNNPDNLVRAACTEDSPFKYQWSHAETSFCTCDWRGFVCWVAFLFNLMDCVWMAELPFFCYRSGGIPALFDEIERAAFIGITTILLLHQLRTWDLLISSSFQPLQTDGKVKWCSCCTIWTVQANILFLVLFICGVCHSPGKRYCQGHLGNPLVLCHSCKIL